MNNQENFQEKIDNGFDEICKKIKKYTNKIDAIVRKNNIDLENITSNDVERIVELLIKEETKSKPPKKDIIENEIKDIVEMYLNENSIVVESIKDDELTGDEKDKFINELETKKSQKNTNQDEYDKEYENFFEMHGDELIDDLNKLERNNRIPLFEIKRLIKKYDENVTSEEIENENLLDNKIFLFIYDYLKENDIIIGGHERLTTKGFHYNNSNLGTRLTRNEEKDLFERMEQGDQAAKRELIERNLRLAIWYVKKYYSKIGESANLEDLIQEAIIGIQNAVEKFDYNKGYRFSTYAFYWLKLFVTRYIENDSRGFRIPSRTFNEITKMNTAILRLEKNLGREPTNEEIAQVMSCPIDRIEELKWSKWLKENVSSLEEVFGQKQKMEDFDYAPNIREFTSNHRMFPETKKNNLRGQTTSREKNEELDNLLDTDRPQNYGENTIIDGVYADEIEPMIKERMLFMDKGKTKSEYTVLGGQIDPEKIVSAKDVSEKLDKALESLTERERKIIELRFGLLDGTPRTLEEVGNEFGVKRETIRKVEARILRKLRMPEISEAFKGYEKEGFDIPARYIEEMIATRKKENEKQETEEQIEEEHSEESTEEPDNKRDILIQQIRECDNKYNKILMKRKKIELEKNDIIKTKEELICTIDGMVSDNLTSEIVNSVKGLNKKLDEIKACLKELEILEIECKKEEKANRKEREKYKRAFFQIMRGGK